MPSINDTAQSADFLPTTPGEVLARGWADENGSPAVDFVLVSGDAYVDHPSFGAAIIGRVLQAEGYRVAMLPQPGWGTTAAFRAFGRPRLAFLVSGGVVDSMVAHYTVAKRRRTFDEYSPGGRTGLRPDRCVEVYAKLAKQAYPDAFVVIGGLEASLRRFAHYDYWTDTVRPSILETSGADLLSFGMGERSLREIAARLAADANATAGAAGSASADANDLTDIAGTAWLADFAQLPAKYAECASYAKVKADKAAYAKACRIQHDNQDPVSALPLVQKQGGRYLVQNLPAAPLDREELDAVYALPFTRRWHPMYDAVPADAGAGQDGAHAAGDDGKKSLVSGVPALEEVAFSIAHNRGCFGGCNFCAITLHQGRRVHSRSEESVLAEARRLTQQPGFKG